METGAVSSSYARMLISIRPHQVVLAGRTTHEGQQIGSISVKSLGHTDNGDCRSIDMMPVAETEVVVAPAIELDD